MKTNLVLISTLVSTVLLGGFGLFDLRNTRDILSLRNFLGGELGGINVEYEGVDLNDQNITPLLERSLADIDGPVGGVEPEAVENERENLLNPETQEAIEQEAISEETTTEVTPEIDLTPDPDTGFGGAAPELDETPIEEIIDDIVLPDADELPGDFQEDFFEDKRGDSDEQGDAYRV